eukprot:6552864-Heterocapsa_arctica.AAC.1
MAEAKLSVRVRSLAQAPRRTSFQRAPSLTEGGTTGTTPSTGRNSRNRCQRGGGALALMRRRLSIWRTQRSKEGAMLSWGCRGRCR